MNIFVYRQDGSTSLLFAVKGGHVEVVTTLLAAGADVNVKTSVS